MHSAKLPAYTPIGIHKNHTDMARFESEDDPDFISVAGELRRWVRQLGQSSGESPVVIETSRFDTLLFALFYSLTQSFPTLS